MVTDFVAVGHGLLPAAQPLLNAVRRNIKSSFDAVSIEDGKSAINLAKSRIVKTQTDCRSFSFRPAKIIQAF